MRVIRSLVAMGAVAAAMFGATGVADAATTTAWRIEYGASVTAGTISWTDGRSASVDGNVHAVSGYRETCVWGVNGTSTTEVACYGANPGKDHPFYHLLTINKVGGVQLIHISFYDEFNHKLGQRGCTRSGCVAE
ncbi:hypothetical protein ACIA5G_40945 [Amycolatopsis sp. NPDC051758]|uniref:hypothetical protein n=1 Tax=Amycolatopsis sp. NPDC051758 TaxID=3363935 RepID=UPI00379573B7